MNDKRLGSQHCERDHATSEVTSEQALQAENQLVLLAAFQCCFPLDLKSRTKASVLHEEIQSWFGNAKQR